MVCPDVYLFGDQEADPVAKIATGQSKKIMKAMQPHDLTRLMFWFKQIIDRFDWIKRANRNLYKDGNPLRHGSIP